MEAYMISVMTFSAACLFVRVIAGEGRLKKAVNAAVSILLIFVCALPLFKLFREPLSIPDITDESSSYTSSGAFVSACELICSDIKSAVMTKHSVDAAVEIDLDVSDTSAVRICEVRVTVPTGDKEKIKATVSSLVMCDNVKIIYEEENGAIY